MPIHPSFHSTQSYIMKSANLYLPSQTIPESMLLCYHICSAVQGIIPTSPDVIQRWQTRGRTITIHKIRLHLKADVLPMRSIMWTVHPSACQTLIHGLQHAHVNWLRRVQFACNKHSRSLPTCLSLQEEESSVMNYKLCDGILTNDSARSVQPSLHQTSRGARVTEHTHRLHEMGWESTIPYTKHKVFCHWHIAMECTLSLA
jgi:hypothetical protein